MKDKKFLDYLIDFLKDILISIIIVLIIYKLLVFPCQVDGYSMIPNLENGEIGVSLRITKNIKINRFDIAVVDIGEKYIVKRVIGLPNEEIEYKDNVLYINGIKYDEDFISDIKTDDFKVILNDDEYYCLGDNRENSIDSRIRGAFKSKQIVATHIFTLYPFSNIGFKK